MKKQVVGFFLCALVSLAIAAISPEQACGTEPLRRGLFISVIQDPQTLSSRDEIDALVEFARKAHIDEFFVQVYYANRAWFRCSVADQEPYEACAKNVSGDAFKLLISKAHAASIRVHAWVNLLSLCNNKDAFILRRYGADVLTRNRKAKRSIEDYRIDNQYFLEPGDPRVRETLSTMVEELVRAYPDLDGIQFDYIRYPDTSPAYGYTVANIQRYKEATGCQAIGECDKAWKDWKRDQVTELLEMLAKKARSMHPGMQVSATGCMPYVRAYYEAFQNWPSWLERGIVDFVTVMSYSPYPDEFGRWIAKAKGKTGDFKKVNIGLGAYKLIRSSGIFEKELRISETSGAGGIVVFHYGSFCEDKALGDIMTGDRHE